MRKDDKEMLRKNDYSYFVKQIEKENKRLVSENAMLKDELNEIKEFKSQYENLVEETTRLRDKYQDLIHNVQILQDEMERQLEIMKVLD